MQKTGAENDFHVQLTDKAKTPFHVRCEKGRVYRAEAPRQRGVRAAVTIPPVAHLQSLPLNLVIPEESTSNDTPKGSKNIRRQAYETR
jgi:hypothetical protein